MATRNSGSYCKCRDPRNGWESSALLGTDVRRITASRAAGFACRASGKMIQSQTSFLFFFFLRKGSPFTIFFFFFPQVKLGTLPRESFPMAFIALIGLPRLSFYGSHHFLNDFIRSTYFHLIRTGTFMHSMPLAFVTITLGDVVKRVHGGFLARSGSNETHIRYSAVYFHNSNGGCGVNAQKSSVDKESLLLFVSSGYQSSSQSARKGLNL